VEDFGCFFPIGNKQKKEEKGSVGILLEFFETRKWQDITIKGDTKSLCYHYFVTCCVSTIN
jgi:hypothetical protein